MTEAQEVVFILFWGAVCLVTTVAFYGAVIALGIWIAKSMGVL